MPIWIEGSENRPVKFQKITRTGDPISEMAVADSVFLSPEYTYIVYDWAGKPYEVFEFSPDLRKDNSWGYVRRDDLAWTTPGESWWPLKPNEELKIENLRIKVGNVIFPAGEPDVG